MKKAMACMLVLALPLSVMAQDPAAASEMEQLKQMLIEQQRQINELKAKLGMPVNAAVPANAHAGMGEVASTKPVLPPLPAAAPVFVPTPTVAAPVPAPDDATSPLQFKLGDAYFTPVGFMDMTAVSRSTNPGSGIGTNFGSIPYSNAQAGALSETFLSPQNSRLGMRIDAMVKDMHVMGYWVGPDRQPAERRLGGQQQPFRFPSAAVLGRCAEGQE